MSMNLLQYRLGAGVEAFTARRDSVLPYPVIQGHQVHGSRIAIVDRPDLTREDLEGYDAFITDIPGIAIGVRTADCTPVLLFDPVHRVIAAVHSGWRGTVSKISQKTVRLMGEVFGTCPADLCGVIGPAVFQASKSNSSPPPSSNQAWMSLVPTSTDRMSGGHHIDLFKANRWILEGCGLKPGNIQIYDIDTFTDLSFYSARREGVGCGRNINSIKLV